MSKPIIVDCRGHLLGRLASILAKQLLNGQAIVAVRTEEINISGSHFRNKLKFFDKLRKHHNTNPKRGPFHFRAPSRILYHTVRGMIPHKTFRGKQALQRLKVFEGIPAPFDKKKRMVIPEAMRVIRLKQGRDFANLGELASQTGWKHADLIKRLEDNRKVRANAWYQKRKATNVLRNKAATEVDA